MANKKIKGITIEIGGETTKLNKALEEVNGKTKSLSAQLKDVNSLLKFDPSNTELLEQKQRILNETIENTKERLDIMRKAQDQITAQFEAGEIDRGQYQKFMNDITRTEQSLESFEKQLGQVNDKLEDSRSETAGAMDSFKDLNKTINAQEAEVKKLKTQYAALVIEKGEASDEAQELARKIEDLSGELKDNKKRVDDARQAAEKLDKSLDDVGDAADASGDGFTIMKGTLADLVSSAIQSAVGAVGDLVGALMDLSEATEEYRIMQAKLQGAAASSGYSAEFVKQKYEDFYKYVTDDQMATNAITNLLGIGTSTENLSSIADGAIAVWTRYGDSIPIESLTESINETINAGKVTGTFADTINWAKTANENLDAALAGNTEAQKAYKAALEEGLPVEDAFNEALKKISNSQERADVVAKFLNSTYGESKTKYDEMTGSVIAANEAEMNLRDTQAELGEGLVPVHVGITNLKAQALDMITPAVLALADAFAKLLSWLNEHPAVLTLLTSLIAGLSVALGVLAGALAIQALIKGVTIAWGALNAVLAANPILLVVSVIAGLVAAIVTLWNTSEEFRTAVLNIWNSLKTAILGAIDSIKQKITEWKTSLDTFVNVTIPGFVNGVVSKFTSIVGKVKKIGSDIVSGLWEGIKSMTGWIGQKVSGFVDGIFNMFAKETDSHSPSRRSAREVGKPVAQGIGVGMTDTTDEIEQQAEQMINDTYDAIDGAMLERAITPKINLDTIQASMTGGNDALLQRVNDLINLVTDYLPDIAANSNRELVLDTGAVVGALTPGVDAQLGSIAALKKRGG